MKNLKLFALLLLVHGIAAQSSATTCQDIFRSARVENRAVIVQTAKRLEAYKASMNSRILEREYVVEPFLISLVAKEHMLLIGPPGNAKTTLAKLLMTNIVDGKDRKTSFYSMQMNKEITLSDTHGGLNFKELSKGAVQRNYHEGLLGAKLGFIDEAFDVRPGAFRNILDILAERAHSQGTSHHKGLTETVVAATNKTLGEVYAEFNNSEQPRALIDRFAYVLFIPKEMDSMASDRKIFKGTAANEKPIQQLTFQDLEVVRNLTKDVIIPAYISSIASVIQYRLTPEFDAREVKSLAEYQEKVRNGEHAIAPYRAAKYLSPRTLAKAGSILRAIVALDYVAKNGQRELTATIDDISKLRSFYQLGGPENKVLSAQLSRSVKEYEKDQIKSVKLERDIVNPMFDSILKEFNESIGDLKLQEIDQLVRDYKILSPGDRRRVVDTLKTRYIDGLNALNTDSKDEIGPKTIAALASRDIVQDSMETLWPGKSQNVAATWAAEAGLSETKLSERQRRKHDRKLIPRPQDTAAGQKPNLPRDRSSNVQAEAPPETAPPETARNAATDVQPGVKTSSEPAPKTSRSSTGVEVVLTKQFSLRVPNSQIQASGDGSTVFEFTDSNVYLVTPKPLGQQVMFVEIADQKRINFSGGSSEGSYHPAAVAASDGKTAIVLSGLNSVQVFRSGSQAKSKHIARETTSGEYPSGTWAAAIVPKGDFEYVTFGMGGSVTLSHIVNGKNVASGTFQAGSGVNDVDLRRAQIAVTKKSSGLFIPPTKRHAVAFKLPTSQGGKIQSEFLQIQNMTVSANGQWAANIGGQDRVHIYEASALIESIFRKEVPTPDLTISSNLTDLKNISFSGDGRKLFVANDLKVEEFDISISKPSARSKSSNSDPSVTLIDHPMLIAESGVVAASHSGDIFSQQSSMGLVSLDRVQIGTKSEFDSVLPLGELFIVYPRGARAIRFLGKGNEVQEYFGTGSPTLNVSSVGSRAVTFTADGIHQHEVNANGAPRSEKISDTPVGFKTGAAVPDQSGMYVALTQAKDRSGSSNWYVVRKNQNQERNEAFQIDLKSNPKLSDSLKARDNIELRMIDSSNGFFFSTNSGRNETTITPFTLQADGQLAMAERSFSPPASSNTGFVMSPNGLNIAKFSPEKVEIFDAAKFHETVKNSVGTEPVPDKTIQMDIETPTRATFSGDGSRLFVDDGQNLQEVRFSLPLNPTAKNLVVKKGKSDLPEGTRLITLSTDGLWLRPDVGPNRANKVLAFKDGFVEFDKTAGTVKFGEGDSHVPNGRDSAVKVEDVLSDGKTLTILADDGRIAELKEIHQVPVYIQYGPVPSGRRLLSTTSPGPKGYLSVYDESSSILGIKAKSLYTMRLGDGTSYKVPKELNSIFENNTLPDLYLIDSTSGFISSKNRLVAFSFGSNGQFVHREIQSDGLFVASPNGQFAAWVKNASVSLFKADHVLQSLLSRGGESRPQAIVTLDHGIASPIQAVFTSDGSSLYIHDGKSAQNLAIEVGP